MKLRHRHPRRTGSVLVLTALFMIGAFAILAFAIDLGYFQVVSSQLQRSADSAAIASAWELVDNSGLGGGDSSLGIANARTAADDYVALNKVSGTCATLADSDVTIGYMQNPSDRTQQITTGDPNLYNAVAVRVRKTADQNGEVPFFFAKVLGMNSLANDAQATAAFLNNFAGFAAPSSGGNVMILPFALDKTTWDGLCAGTGDDNWSWDPDQKQISAGRDGKLEVNLFPQGTGSPGNRGTVDIGNSNNSTADIARQIVYGISPADLAYHGGKLQFNSEGKLYLNGDTGISAGVKDELASIKGQPRIMPIFDNVSDNGNNSTYTIVGFAGVRILDVDLTGSMSSKRVIVQPARVTAYGGIPGNGAQTSNYLFSPVWLVR